MTIKALPETFLEVDWTCVDGRRYKTLYCISSMENFTLTSDKSVKFIPKQ